MRKVIIMILLSFVVMILAQDYKIIRSEDGKWILEEEDIKTISAYIMKLEALVDNYKQQISVLEEMNRNLQEQVSLLEKKVAMLEDEVKKYQAANVTQWIVVAAVAVGSIIFLFVK